MKSGSLMVDHSHKNITKWKDSRENPKAILLCQPYKKVRNVILIEAMEKCYNIFRLAVFPIEFITNLSKFSIHSL